MPFVLIPGGEFMMGSSDTEVGRESDEGPRRKVRIKQPFYLGKYEVTQEEYEKIMGKNPSYFPHPRHPVEEVRWQDAMAFCEELSKREGKTYQLPTEAQWEYACRAGNTARYCFGDDEGERDLAPYAWYGTGSHGTTHPVGEKKPNAWGLYDMHGNVWEWGRETYWPFTYQHLTGDDPEYAGGGDGKVVRGGSWGSLAAFVRSANRNRGTPMLNYIGFRVLLVIPSEGK